MNAREFYYQKINPDSSGDQSVHEAIIRLLEDFGTLSFNAARQKELKSSSIAWNGTTQNKYGFKYSNFKRYAESNS